MKHVLLQPPPPEEQGEHSPSGKTAYYDTFYQLSFLHKSLPRLTDDPPPPHLVTNHSSVRVLLRVNSTPSRSSSSARVGGWTFTEFTVGAGGNLHTMGPPLL